MSERLVSLVLYVGDVWWSSFDFCRDGESEEQNDEEEAAQRDMQSVRLLSWDNTHTHIHAHNIVVNK